VVCSDLTSVTAVIHTFAYFVVGVFFSGTQLGVLKQCATQDLHTYM
jgi:hypothetical protein